jgi:ferric-dicitrate binding protein FerR (iron transport regulator)
MDEDLLIRYLTEELSIEERAVVERWRSESDKNEQTLEQFYFVLQTSDRLRVMRSANAYTGSALNQLKNKIRKNEKKLRTRRVLYNLQRVAAVLFLPVLFLSLWLLGEKNNNAPMQYVELYTNPGMVSSFYLPDSSQVWLNGGSRLRYPIAFQAERREIEISGQGYFEVSRNPNQPFLVKTRAGFAVEVLGTAFNLAAYDDEDIVETTLVEGSIKLNLLQNGHTAQRTMQAGEKAVYVKNGQTLRMETVDPKYDIAWKSRQIVFKNHPMEYVVRTLGRYYNVPFLIRDNQVMDAEITGSFSNEHLSQVMEYLRIASDISYKIKSSTAKDGRIDPGIVGIVEIWKEGSK